MDLYISISQVGDGVDYLPYIVLENYDYLCDEHLIEMYDRMPRDQDGNLDVNSVVHTPHHYQIFSKPFNDDPFNLKTGSEVTVAINDLPYSSLVALSVDAQQNYEYEYLGTQETFDVNVEELYMLKNLALFTDAYNLDEPVIQDGSINLYYGSGTDVMGERNYDKRFYMTHATGETPPDYWSQVDGSGATSWEKSFTFADTFLTTNEIVVSGTVYYHQMFDLDLDVIAFADINDLFSDSGIENIQFGIQMPDDISVSYIKSIGEPYQYELSVQGFPTGDYIDSSIYYTISSPPGAISYNPSTNILESGTHYSLEYLSNGDKYLLFYENEAFVSAYTNADNIIMVDYWAYHQFTEGEFGDYIIKENPDPDADPYESDIEWYYTYGDTPSLHFTMHPDFTLDSSFRIEYSGLTWRGFDNTYLSPTIDNIDFQPRIKTNISLEYTGQSSTTFSILNVVPDNQLSEPDLFNYIYLSTWDGINEETKDITKLAYSPTYITQDAQVDFLYIIDLAGILTDISPDVIEEDTYVFIETEFDSTQLKYSLSNTPFNFDYIPDTPADNHITIDINNGQIVWTSNQPEFLNYVEKIENNYIYFKDGAINPGSTVDVSYRYKLQPGLLESKHFLMVVYPWTNVFDTILSDVVSDTSSDSSITYREKYRKLAGGSIMSPFEYSLSVEDTYSLYISYRLNQRDYYEEKFDITDQRYIDNDFTFTYLTAEFSNYFEELVIDSVAAVTVYYFDFNGQYRLLDNEFYSTNPLDNKVTLIPKISGGIDSNPLTAHNNLDEFFISIVPKSEDIEYNSYRFTYDPRLDVIDTLDVTNWDVVGVEGLDVFANLDAYWFMNDKESVYDNFVCHASQIASYLQPGNKLRFDIVSEFGVSGEYNLLLNDILGNEYLSLFIDTNIKNHEAISDVTINLLDSGEGVISSDTISIEDLLMNDFEIKVDTSSGMTLLKYVEIEPVFRQDGVYDSDNNLIPKFEIFEWNEELAVFDEDGNKFMSVPLENELITETTTILRFNNKMQYLDLIPGSDFTWESTENEFTRVIEYTLQIPNMYLNPDNPVEELEFIGGDTIVVRYNTPVKRAISIAIGELYFQKKPYAYSPSLSAAECLLVNVDDYEDFTTITNPYYYKIPLELTPFNTEFSGSYKTIKINFDLSDGQIDPQYIVDNLIEFSDLILSVPYPNYELTINEIGLQSQSTEPSTVYEVIDERVWQFTELDEFTSGDDPETDAYDFSPTNTPLFWGDNKWLDYLLIYDEDYNYYSSCVQEIEQDHQLHFASNQFVWNDDFNVFQEYYGSQVELPLIVDSNKDIYFAYSTLTSWQSPISIDYENVDIGTIDVVFDYDYLLTPRFEEWDNVIYENTEFDYEVTQYYTESFAVYTPSATQYTHQYDIDYSFVDDFTSLQVYKVIALSPTFEDIEIINGFNDYNWNFDPVSKEFFIEDVSGTRDLTDFDLITVILSFSYGPISTYSEIVLSQSFHDTYVIDAEDTFFDYLSLSFGFSTISGEGFFAEDSQTITSDWTSFEAIDFNRNPDISSSNLLNNPESKIFIDFEVFEDPFNLIYEADLDMDGKMEYKQEIDLDKDGRIDITKYGVEDDRDSENIIWYSIIQDYVTEEIVIDKKVDQEQKTEWFDIDDTLFSDYELNILLLLASILFFPLMAYTLSTMILPDVDYWAQKSVEQETTETRFTKSRYYSIRLDDNHDGFTDTQITYERSDTVIEYESNDYEKTIIAAKPQNIFTVLGEWIAKSVDSMLGKPPKDLVFNEDLTEDKLDNSDFSYLNDPFKASTLQATYRKFTKDTTITYTSESVSEQITAQDWANGTIEQTRIYRDVFDNEDIDSEVLASLFKTEKYKIIDLDSGQEQSYTVKSPFSITTPELRQIVKTSTSWEENIPERFDSLTTIIDGEETTTNEYEAKIELVIPGRFSLYNDMYVGDADSAIGDTEFTATGIFITPPDGLVYHSSSKELFKAGKGKSRGHYFYYDSDDNGFYETVYVLEPKTTTYESVYINGRVVRDANEVSFYMVKAIGYNYDGQHDFAPYKKVNRIVRSETDFDQLEAETPRKFGLHWVVNFKKLKKVDLIFPDDPFDGYEVKDHIFEISKLVDTSQFNSKFSELFYEARHQTYTDAWKQYEQQLVQDIIEQVFMTLTASAISSALNLIPLVGQVLGPLGYFLAYTLMTKFSMDVKSHIADSQAKAFSFYPLDGDRKQKTSLSERTFSDKEWGDNMPAALMGHPGAYYAPVQGEDDSQIYSAQAVVSPPNPLRDTSDNIGGFLEFLWDNLWKTTESNPDLFTGLDFDGLNLDFLLMTNELSALNDLPGYSFTPNVNQGKYNDYRQNTLGYLQQKIKEESNGKLDAIRPIIIDGKPQYIFIDSTEGSNQLTTPLSHLYQPVVVSSDRAKYINQEAKIEIDIVCAYTPITQGIDVYQNLIPEEKELYASKIPLSNIAFNYPIKSVELELIESTISEPRVINSIELSESDYSSELGSLYIKEAIDSIFFPSQSAFNLMVLEGVINPSSRVYYRVKIMFDLVVEDSGSDEHNKMALTQATSYAVMDYFNQHTYASVTANMIGEIAYTETLTLISTLISTAVLFLGSWATMGSEQAMASIGVTAVKSTLLTGLLVVKAIVVSAIKEVFQEIIMDGFIETWAQRQVELWGGSEDMGYWFSALCTSGREALMGSGKAIRNMFKAGSIQQATITTALDNSDNLATWVAQNMGKDYISDSKLRREIMKQIEVLIAQGETDILLSTQEKSSMLKIISSGLATAFKFSLSSMFLGSQTMTSILSLSGFTSMIKGVSAGLYGRYKTDLHNSRINRIKDVKRFINKKSDIDQEANANEFAKQTGLQMPSTNMKVKPPAFTKIPSGPIVLDALSNKLDGISTSLSTVSEYAQKFSVFDTVETLQNRLTLLEDIHKTSQIVEEISSKLGVNRESIQIDTLTFGGEEGSTTLRDVGSWSSKEDSDSLILPSTDLTINELEIWYRTRANVKRENWVKFILFNEETMEQIPIENDVEINGHTITSQDSISKICSLAPDYQLMVGVMDGDFWIWDSIKSEFKFSTNPEILDFRSKLYFLFGGNHKKFDNIFLKQPESEVLRFIDKFTTKSEQLFKGFTFTQRNIKERMIKEFKSMFMDKFLVIENNEKDKKYNDAVKKHWKTHYEFRIKNTNSETLFKVYKKCFEIGVMTEIFESSNINSVTDPMKVLAKLEIVLDSNLLSSPKVANKILENFYFEGFGLLFLITNAHKKVGAFYSTQAQRNGALSELDVLLNFASIFLKDIYYSTEVRADVLIATLDTFNFNEGRENIGSEPFLSTQDSTRFPDLSIWQFYFDKTSQDIVMVFPIKHESEKRVGKTALIDTISSIYAQSRENLNKGKLKYHTVRVPIINLRHSIRGCTDFMGFFKDFLSNLKSLTFYDLYGRNKKYKVSKRILGEEIVIRTVNSKIGSFLSPEAYKQELAQLSKDYDFINNFIVNPYKSTNLFSIKNIPTIQSFLKELAGAAVVSTWNIIDEQGLIKSVTGIQRTSGFEFYSLTDINNKKLGDFSEFSSIFLLDDSGMRYTNQKTNPDTLIDRAFRIIHNIDDSRNQKFALAEVSHKTLVSNPLGWSDGMIVEEKIIYNALFTEHSGALLSSNFFDPFKNLFEIRNDDEIISDILSSSINNHLNLLLVFSKTDSNAHLNDLFKLDMFNPIFDPKYNYELREIKDYFSNLENLIDFPKIQSARSKKTETFKAINAKDFGQVITLKDFSNLYLNLFDFKNLIVKPGVSSTRLPTVNPFFKEVIGLVNILGDTSSGKVDFSSERNYADIEGITNKLFTQISDINKFLFKKIDNDGNLITMHKSEYSLKQWLNDIFVAILNFDETPSGTNPQEDRVIQLINDAKALIQGTTPLDISSGHENLFSLSELNAGKAIMGTISKLFGHVTMRLILFQMVQYYTKEGIGVGLDFTSLPKLKDIETYLAQFQIIAAGQSRETTMDFQTVPFHLFSLFFLDSLLYLPTEGNLPNSETNAVHLGSSPISFISDSFSSSGKTQMDADIETIFITKYLIQFASLYSQKGSEYTKAKLFIESGRNIMKALEKKLNSYFSNSPDRVQIVNELLLEATDQIFKVSDHRISVQGVRKPNLRIQIEKLITCDQNSVDIIFHRQGFSIRLEKDDFAGYDIKIWSRIRGLTQSYVNDLSSKI